MRIWTNQAETYCYEYENLDWACYAFREGTRQGCCWYGWVPAPLDPGRAVIGELHATLRRLSGDKVSSKGATIEWSPRLERFQVVPEVSSIGPPYQAFVTHVLYALSPLAVQVSYRWGVEPSEVDVAAYERGRENLRALIRSLSPRKKEQA